MTTTKFQTLDRLVDAGSDDESPGGTMTDEPVEKMYITVGRAGGPVRGFTWRLWASGTSFYLKARTNSLSTLKLSIHGDDPRHPAGGGLKFGMDTEQRYQDAAAAKKIVTGRSGDWPIWFPGEPVDDSTRRVARLRWTWDACTRLPLGPQPGQIRAGEVGVAVPPPPQPGDAVDLDLIISETRPYWPCERQARADNACLGPLRNTNGTWLTGTVIRRRASHTPPPENAVVPRPHGRTDEIRALGVAVSDSGLLWIVEQRMSRSHQPTVE